MGLNFQDETGQEKSRYNEMGKPYVLNEVIILIKALINVLDIITGNIDRKK